MNGLEELNLVSNVLEAGIPKELAKLQSLKNQGAREASVAQEAQSQWKSGGVLPPRAGGAECVGRAQPWQEHT